MRIDFRPQVVARVMSKELLLFICALLSAFGKYSRIKFAGMPLYYLKWRKMSEQ